MQKGPSARQTANGFYANVCHEEENNAVTKQEEAEYRVFIYSDDFRRKQTDNVRNKWVVGNVENLLKGHTVN